jgi:hypothetical protein
LIVADITPLGSSSGWLWVRSRDQVPNGPPYGEYVYNAIAAHHGGSCVVSPFLQAAYVTGAAADNIRKCRTARDRICR